MKDNNSTNSVMPSSPKTRFLLNPTTATNLIFEVEGLNEDSIESINSLKGSIIVIRKMQEIIRNGGTLRFLKMSSSTFEDNLKLIAPDFPKYLSELIKMYYQEGASNCKNAVENAAYYHLMDYEDISIYKELVVCFLEALDSGMRPSKPWDGQITSMNGEYLLQSTRFARGSTHREKHMMLYQENGHTYIKLNFGIMIL